MVTKEGILAYLEPKDIYRYYTGKPVVINGPNIHSPLRDEKNPSFSYFRGKSGNIHFKDFAGDSGDVFTFVMLKFGLTFFEALSKLVVDFNLINTFLYKKINKTSKTYDIESLKNKEKLLSTANKCVLGVRKRKWMFHDMVYWKNFGISKKTLEKYNVYPIDFIFFDGNPIKADNYAYVFYEYKDNIETIKIYQPYNEKYKWLNNHNNSVWQGWKQLPQKGDKLIITKSLKDVMAIHDVLDIPSVSLQAEGVAPKQQVVDELNRRFSTIFLLYDNDYDKKINIGETLGYNFVKDQFITQISIPSRLKSKDFSDLVKAKGQVMAKSLYTTDIEMPY